MPQSDDIATHGRKLDLDRMLSTEPVDQRLIVALDVPSVADAAEVVRQLDGLVSFYKIGHHLLLAPGMERLIEKLKADGNRVFLDLKLYDIPATVAAGVRRAADRGAAWVTVYRDYTMLRAAVDASIGTRTKVFAVGALSSDVATVDRGVVVIAMMAGCHGVIAPAATSCNTERGHSGLLFATPGVRLARSADIDDHAAVVTPSQAIRNGANYIIVGRPIVQADAPRKAARDIIRDMEEGSSSARGTDLKPVEPQG